MAIEDAAVLGNLLSHISHRSQLKSLLYAYESLRLPRASATQASSRLNQTIFHLPDGPDQEARDFQMRKAMEAALLANDREEWAALNRRFHLTISELPGLDLVKDLTAKVLDRWDRLRRFYFKGVLANRVEQAQQEHRLILDAMRARDLIALQSLVRQHNHGALQAYLSFLDASEPVAVPAIVTPNALRTPDSMI